MGWRRRSVGVFLATGSCRLRGYAKGEGDGALYLGTLGTMFRVNSTVAYQLKQDSECNA